MPPRLRRSILSVPGTSPRMLAKASGLGADEVFLDLEDAVAPAEKNDATRQQVVEALVGQEWVAPTRAVRVNAVSTQWCFRDVVYVVAGAGRALHCVIVPKVQGPDEVHFVDHLLTQLETELGREVPVGLELQIESARGVEALPAIAAASTRTETLVFGPGDYAADLGIQQLSVGAIERGYPGDQWHYVLSRLVVAARARGLQAIDGPFAAVRDLDGFRESAERARLLGCEGKWALHPDQIALANAAFTPGQAQYDDAETLLKAYRKAVGEGRGAVRFRGEMIDEASRKLAEQIVARGRAAGLQRSDPSG